MVKLRTSAKHKKKNIKKYSSKNKKNKHKKTINQKRYKRKRYSRKMIGGEVCLSENSECLKLVGSVKGNGNKSLDVAMGLSQSPVREIVQQESLPKKTDSSWFNRLLNRFGYETSKWKSVPGKDHFYQYSPMEVFLEIKKIESPPIETHSSVVTTTSNKNNTLYGEVVNEADRPQQENQVQTWGEKKERGIKPENNMSNEQQFQQQVNNESPSDVAEGTSFENKNISVQPPDPPTKNEEELANTGESLIGNTNNVLLSQDDSAININTGEQVAPLLRSLSLNDMRQESETQEKPNIVTRDRWVTERNNKSDVREKNSEIIEEKEQEQQIEDTVENDENNGEFTLGPEYESVEEVENEYDNSDRYNKFDLNNHGGKTRTRRSRKMKTKKRKSRASRKIRKNKKIRK